MLLSFSVLSFNIGSNENPLYYMLICKMFLKIVISIMYVYMVSLKSPSNFIYNSSFQGDTPVVVLFALYFGVEFCAGITGIIQELMKTGPYLGKYI